jgi:hypothetical protein
MLTIRSGSRDFVDLIWRGSRSQKSAFVVVGTGNQWRDVLKLPDGKAVTVRGINRLAWDEPGQFGTVSLAVRNQE